MPVYGTVDSAQKSIGGKKTSAKQKTSGAQKKGANAPAGARWRKGYTYVHPRSGKKVAVQGAYIARRSLSKEPSKVYQAKRAAGAKRRASEADERCDRAGKDVPTEAECRKQGKILRAGSVYTRNGKQVVRCASCVEDVGQKGKGGKVKIYLKEGTLEPYKLSDASMTQRRESLKKAVARLAKEHKKANPSLSAKKAKEAAASTARSKLQVLSLQRKNGAKGTAQGAQCVRALEDEAWLRTEYGMNPLDWSARTCFGEKMTRTKAKSAKKASSTKKKSSSKKKTASATKRGAKPASLKRKPTGVTVYRTDDDGKRKRLSAAARYKTGDYFTHEGQKYVKSASGWSKSK